jgi:hypothetical protein
MAEIKCIPTSLCLYKRRDRDRDRDRDRYNIYRESHVVSYKNSEITQGK